MRLRLVPRETSIDFFRFGTVFLVASALLMVVSLALLPILGLNLGIDFRGGTLLTVSTPGAVDVGLLRGTLDGLGLGDVSVTSISEPLAVGPDTSALIRIEQIAEAGVDSEAIAGAKAALEAAVPGIVFDATESVGAKVSGELVQAGVIAVTLSVFAVLVYIWLRFEWQFSVGAVAALVHDVVLTLGIFALVRIEFNLSIIAAILTIVGYSLNDTVVVFDRVRENLRKYKTTELREVLNISINETLSRTVMTSVTTLLALISLYVLGGEVIRGFTFAMIWGVIVGTYSSVFVAAVVLLRLGVSRGDETSKAGTTFADIDA